MKFPKFNIWFWLLIALLLRFYKLTHIYCIASDGTAYIDVAYQILQGKGFHPIWPPLYPWLISCLLRLGLNPELCGGLVSVFFGVVTVGLVYVVTRSITTIRLAQVATIFAVFHPFLVRYSAEVLSDSLFTCLLISVIFLGWLGLAKKNLLLSVAVGFITALIYLTKPEGIVVLIIISCWWLLGRKQESVGSRLVNIVCAWVIFILVSLPYFASIYEDTGKWMISKKQTIVFAIELKKEGYIENLQDIAPWEYLAQEPASFFHKMGKDMLVLLGRLPDAYHPLLFVLLLIGLFQKWNEQEKKYLRYVFSFIVVYFIGYAIYHPGRRYLVGWVPVTLLLAAGGWQGISAWIENKYHYRLGTVLLVIIVIILLPSSLSSERSHSRQWREAGLWLKANGGFGSRIMAQDERIAFYAQAEHVPWGTGRGDFVVSRKIVPGLKLVHYTSKGVRIYDR